MSRRPVMVRKKNSLTVWFFKAAFSFASRSFSSWMDWFVDFKVAFWKWETENKIKKEREKSLRRSTLDQSINQSIKRRFIGWCKITSDLSFLISFSRLSIYKRLRSRLCCAATRFINFLQTRENQKPSQKTIKENAYCDPRNTAKNASIKLIPSIIQHEIAPDAINSVNQSFKVKKCISGKIFCKKTRTNVHLMMSLP